MSDVIESAITAARELEQSIGPITLFGLFRRKTGIGLWDLVVCAPWLPADDPESLRTLFQELKGYLGPDDLVQLSRGVLLDADDEFMRSLDDVLSFRVLLGPGRMVARNGAAFGGQDLVELRDVHIGELDFDRVVIVVFNPQVQALTGSTRGRAA
jgi:hypothetical protein